MDDHTIFRESLIAALSLQKDFEVVGQAATVSEARTLIGKSKPNILLLDL